MFTLPQRIGIIILTAGYGVYLLTQGSQLAWVIFACVAMFVIGYFRYGPIRPAFMAMVNGDLEFARSQSEAIRFPQWLSAQSQAYLHWIKGVLAMHDGDLDTAESQMQLAIDGKLRTSNDRCVATTVLARIAAKKNEMERAKQLLAEAEQIPHKPKAKIVLDEVKAEFEKWG